MPNETTDCISTPTQTDSSRHTTATIGYVPKFHDSVKYTGWLRDTILSTDDTIVYLPSEEKET
jgi:hypothetical protein